LWPRDVAASKTTKAASGFLRPRGLEAFLRGEVPEFGEIVAAGDIFGHDRRTGIGIAPDRLAAQESLIYAVEFLALKQGWTLYTEVAGPAEALSRLAEKPFAVALGGEGRRAMARRVTPFRWPEAGVESPGQGALYLLTTPGLFSGGWDPGCLPLLAAAVPGHLAVSGWDLARGGPKPNRFAAQAGSVYFLEQPLEPRRESLCTGEDAVLGWGSILQGVWNHD
jgi:CRISPR-associated protein Cmr3